MSQINIENLEIDKICIGSSDDVKVYLGDVKLYPTQSQSLPDGYTELQYVENVQSGWNYSRTDYFYVQYDDTAYASADTYIYNVVFELTVPQGSSAYWDILGNSYVQIQKTNSSGNHRFEPRAFGEGGIGTTIQVLSNVKYDVTIYKGASDTYPTFEVTNVSASTTSTNLINDYTWSMSHVHPKLGVLCYYAVSDSGARTTLGRIYSVTVTDRDGNIKCKAVPCRRESDGKIGMYNLARNEFTYDTSGLMNIVGGPEVN